MRPPTVTRTPSAAATQPVVVVRHDMPMGAVLQRWDDAGRDTVWLNEAYPALWPAAMLSRRLDLELLPR